MRPLRWAAAGGFIAFGAAALACSENAGESVIPDQATAAAGGTIIIEARDFSFVPDRAESQDTTVTIELRNTGAEHHSLTVYESDDYTEPVEDAVIESLAAGETATVSFDVPEGATTLNFRCEIHPDRMNGELAVGGSPTGDDDSPTAGATTGATPEEED